MIDTPIVRFLQHRKTRRKYVVRLLDSKAGMNFHVTVSYHVAEIEVPNLKPVIDAILFGMHDLQIALPKSIHELRLRIKGEG